MLIHFTNLCITFSRRMRVSSFFFCAELITEAIVALAERGGSSRQALKSFIKEKYPVGENFDTQFNLAVKRGLETEFFSQPKGPAGSIKLVKKPKAESKKAAPYAVKKSSTTKKPAATTKKSSTSSKKASAGKVVKKESSKKTTAKKAATKKAPAKKTAVKKSKK